LFFILATSQSCGSIKQQHKSKPDWVKQRPTNDFFYVGIGVAAKAANPFDFQQVAKKNAVYDLISEIKVTVSSHSLLSQLQNDKQFSQQFESDVKVTAANTIEQFNVIDSWEDKDFFWIYYRLNKEEFKAIQQKKIDAAIEQAVYLLNQAESLTKAQLMQSIRLKIKALSALQPYVNQDLQTVFQNRNVYIVNELINSIQSQLYSIEIKSKISFSQAKVGKPITEPFEVLASYRNTNEPVPFLPITMFSEQHKVEGTILTETDQNGIGAIAVSRIIDKAPVQTIRVAADIKNILKSDSLNAALQKVLLSIDVPSTAIRLSVAPTKIFMEADEKNLDKKLTTSFFEPALKMELIDEGYVFTDVKNDADYTVMIHSNTRAEGNIWGSMKLAILNMNIVIIDNTNKTEIYKNVLSEIKGFQLTAENAGLDAYKTASKLMISTMYNSIRKGISQGK